MREKKTFGGLLSLLEVMLAALPMAGYIGHDVLLLCYFFGLQK